MKCILLYLLLLMSALAPFGAAAGTKYHYYFDSSCQWRTYGGGWNLFYGYSEHYTTYFDGDTMVGTEWYYKRYTLELDTLLTNPPYVDTVLQGPWLVREDSSHKIWVYDAATGRDRLENDYGAPVKIGDTFQVWSPTCTVGVIDSVYFGGVPLKRVRPILNNDSLLMTRG